MNVYEIVIGLFIVSQFVLIVGATVVPAYIYRNRIDFRRQWSDISGSLKGDIEELKEAL